MTTTAPWTPPVITPVDPKSENGRRIARELGELIGDVEDRLAREAAEAEIRKGAAPTP